MVADGSARRAGEKRKGKEPVGMVADGPAQAAMERRKGKDPVGMVADGPAQAATERRKGKEPIELGDDSSTGAVIALSDTDSVGSTACITGKAAAKLKKVRKVGKDFVKSASKSASKSAAKVKKVAKDCVGERTNQQVLDKGKDVVDSPKEKNQQVLGKGKGKNIVDSPKEKKEQVLDKGKGKNIVDSPKEQKIAKDLLGERKDQKALAKEKSRVLQIFPKACPETVEEDLAAQFKKTSPGLASERVINRYLEIGYPKAKEAPQQDPKPDLPQVVIETPMDRQARTMMDGVGTSNARDQQMDTNLEVLPPEIQANYQLWTFYTLNKEYPRYPLLEMKRVLCENNDKFTPSYEAIGVEYRAALNAERAGGPGRRRAKRNGLKLNIRARDNRDAPSKPKEPCEPFEREWQKIQRFNTQPEGGVEQVTERLKTGTGPEPGPSSVFCEGEGSGSADIECGCCCMDYRFEEMVQCAEGHLFCFTCLRRRIEESTFGGAKASNLLPCMDTSGCEEVFPWSEVKRALPPDVLAKYEQRQAEDAVVQAKITGLVYCPFCNTPWEIDPDMKVLECANETCRKASCVNCREPNHIPLRCEEVEKNSETALRRSIEERMTKALLRVCSACKAELLKSDGCNKVTCRCGKTMCYVCRQPIAPNYQHFCQHSRPGPKVPCTICKKCNLWEEEEEVEVVKAAREAAMKELGQDDPNLLKRTIGPKLEKAPKKKARLPPAPFQPPPPEYYNRAAQAMIHVAEEFIDNM